MPSPTRKIRLIYFVVATLLLVGLVPLVLTGYFLSQRSGKELRAAENRYQIQLVQEKAGRIEAFAAQIESTVDGLASAIELSGSDDIFASESLETKLGSILKDDPTIAAVYIKPASTDALSIFRTELLARGEVETLAAAAMKDATAEGISPFAARRLAEGRPHFASVARRVQIRGTHIADIVAVASLQDISQSIVGLSSMSNDDIWKAGLPIVFVVDQKGRAVFHPDAGFANSSRPMTDLKIVSEWIESGRQVQSALVPFNAEHAETSHEMIGAYSTARVGRDARFGVFTMQDEAKALASVAEMRNQTWLISMAFAVLALVVGSIGARFMTAPLMRLVDAARNLAAGDFSTRVNMKSRTEIGTLGDTFDLMTDKIEEQIANLAKAAEENRELFVGTVKALAAAIDGKDKYTRGHSERVARISVAIGKRMDLPADELETLRISALLHDVGKIAIDDNILKKPAALTDEEFEIMKQHPVRGYKIMSQIPAMKDFLPGMYMHHEMVNGKGYPQGLTGDEIPLQAKIVSVADTFDAMTIDRPYQKGMELGAALERIRSFVDTRYQHEVVEALVEACNAGEIGQGIIRQLAEKRAAEAASSDVEPAKVAVAAPAVAAKQPLQPVDPNAAIPKPDEMLVDASSPALPPISETIAVETSREIATPAEPIDATFQAEPLSPAAVAVPAIAADTSRDAGFGAMASEYVFSEESVATTVAETQDFLAVLDEYVIDAQDIVAEPTDDLDDLLELDPTRDPATDTALLDRLIA